MFEEKGVQEFEQDWMENCDSPYCNLTFYSRKCFIHCNMACRRRALCKPCCLFSADWEFRSHRHHSGSHGSLPSIANTPKLTDNGDSGIGQRGSWAACVVVFIESQSRWKSMKTTTWHVLEVGALLPFSLCFSEFGWRTRGRTMTPPNWNVTFLF